MQSDHPFQMLFETFGRAPLAHAESVNRAGRERLCQALSVPLSHPGACTLLRAPRAGHGKTHLLSRVMHQFVGSHEFILMKASRGYRIEPTTVLEDVVGQMLRDEPTKPQLTRMDVFTRRLLATGLQAMVETGEVPCEDRNSALQALRSDPLGTLDFGNPSAVTAQWVRDTHVVLLERLAQVLALECSAPMREVSQWLEILFQHTSAQGGSRRHRALEEKLFADHQAEAVAMNRLESLLALMCMTRRIVLIADDLEGLSGEPGAALKLSTLVLALRQSVPNLEVILSLNRDVWEAVFVPCLSEGLADRVAERLIELEPLRDGEMLELLESRAPGYGTAIIASMDKMRAGTHARGVIREAAEVWLKTRSQPAALSQTTPAGLPASSGLSGMPVAAKSLPAVALPPGRVPDELCLAGEKVPEKTGVDVSPAAHDAGPVAQPGGVGEAGSTPASALNPQDAAEVEALLRQFRERFGQQRS